MKSILAPPKSSRLPSVIGLLLLSPLLVSCGPGESVASAPRRAPLVEVVEARSGHLPLEEVVNGVVRAHNQVVVRPEISAAVIEVLVKSGEAVERGQPLVRLRDDELRERLRQAEADVRLAEATAAEARARVEELRARLGRTRALAEQELVSEQELETMEAQAAALQASADAAAARVEQAQATAEERRSALAKAVVRSPVAGRVGERRVEVGMLVDPGTALFTVGNLDRLVVEVTLTGEMLSRVEEGQTVVIGDGRGTADEPVVAALSRVSPFLAERSFTTVGEIDLEQPPVRLHPGAFVSVRILYGESSQATLVPTSAVWEEPATRERGVFVVDDAGGLETPGSDGIGQTSEKPRRVTFRAVEVLAEGRGVAGVSGVDDGDWVVIVGQHMLHQQAADTSTDGGGDPGPMTAEARVRVTSWERVEALQSLQREDLLAGFLDKQQRVSAVLGAEIPESEEVVDRVLRGEQPEAATAAGGS